MSKLVTIGVPVYKRLDYLPAALRSIVAQDYPDLDILISDNGENGPKLRELAERHCSRPFRMRHNPRSVPMPRHFNQLVEEASGEYYLMLSDDDELAPNYVSSLVSALDSNPDAALALGRLERMDETGRHVPRREKPLPSPFMPATEFIRSWCGSGYDYVCFVTNMARTAEIRAVGAYPDFPKGNWVDNALVVKLVLGRGVAFVHDAVFRYRVYEASTGLSATYRELTTAASGFIRYLDADPVLAAYAREHPAEWSDIKAQLVEMTWRTCRSRWSRMYRGRMSGPAWVSAAFTMPFIPGYYRAVSSTLLRSAASGAKRLLLGRSEEAPAR